MSTDFAMKFRHNHGDLFVQARGTFDGNSAHELLLLLQQQYPGSGRVFIDTKDLSEVLPFGCKVLQTRLYQTAVPAGRLFFKGEKGFKMAPNGSRVLLIDGEKKKAGCCGNCAHCTCKHAEQVTEH